MKEERKTISYASSLVDGSFPLPPGFFITSEIRDISFEVTNKPFNDEYFLGLILMWTNDGTSVSSVKYLYLGTDYTIDKSEDGKVVGHISPEVISDIYQFPDGFYFHLVFDYSDYNDNTPTQLTLEYTETSGGIFYIVLPAPSAELNQYEVTLSITEEFLLTDLNLNGPSSYCKLLDLSSSGMNYERLISIPYSFEELKLPQELDILPGIRSSQLTKFEVPENISKINPETLQWDLFQGLTVNEKNITYDSRNNCNCIIETSTNTVIKGSSLSIIPESVTALASFSFSELSLTELRIPENIKVEENAFSGCSIGKIDVPSIKFWCESLIATEMVGVGLGYLPDLFIGGKELDEELIIPNTVNSIQDNCFYKNKKLKKLFIPGSVKSIIGSAIDYCTNLEELTLESGIEIFSGISHCTNLKTLIIPNTVVAANANPRISFSIYSCESLENLQLSENLSSLAVIISRCNSLTEIIIPDQIATVNIDHCNNLTRLVLGRGITYIGDNKIKSNPVLTSITCYAKVAPELDDSFYLNSKVGTLYYPKGSDYSTWLAELGSGWEGVEIDV